jgi:hypothetical protein
MVKINLNIILTPTPESSKWSFPFRVSDHNFVCIPPACYMSRLSHAPWFHFPSITGLFQEEQLMKLHPPHFSAICYFLSHTSAYSLRMFSNILNLYALFNLREQVSHPWKTNDKNCSYFALGICIADWNTEDADVNVASIPWTWSVLTFVKNGTLTSCCLWQ